MAGFWPLYSNFVTKSQVTLALPGKPSNISKSVGGNFPALLLVPNVDFLVAFIKGNIGIADAMTKAAMVKNLNSPIAANDEMVARHFSKVNKLGLEDNMDKYKDKATGKIKIPKGDIALSSENDSLGFKAMEKTILQSIFETQKPYMEIAKMVIDVMISIEDIIARVMPLLAPPPPINIATSDKPVGNAGSGSRPAAIGYQKGAAIKKAIAELDKITKTGGKLTVNKDGTTSKTPAPLTDDEKDAKYGEGASDFSDLQNAKLRELGKKWQIVNAVYSTGDYDPTVDYEYTYKDIVEDEIPNQGEEPEDDEDPYDKYKPKRIILGIFDSKGVPMNPAGKLKTIGFSGAVETNFSRASWVLNSSKWVFPKSTSPNALVWPSFGTPIYTWERLGGLDQKTSKTQPSSSSPAPSYSLKKYKEGDKNKLNGLDAIVGDPVIAGFDPAEMSIYTRYFTEYTTINMNLAKELTDAEKQESIKTIMSQLNVVSHLENVNLYGQAKTSYYKDYKIPETMKLSFMPMQITVEEAKNDPKLAGLNGKIWIDPESDYETKIIEVKPVTKIAYSAVKGEPEVQVDIKSFVKNVAIFKIAGGRKFSIDVRRGGASFESFTDVDQYSLDNWNYNPDTRQIIQGSFLEIDIWSKDPAGMIESHFKNSSPTLLMTRSNGLVKHGDYHITIIKSSDGVYSYNENSYVPKYDPKGNYIGYDTNGYKPFNDGYKKLGDGSIVYVQDKKITKWYFVQNKIYTNTELPPFGKEYTTTFDLNNRYEKNSSIFSSYYEAVSSFESKDIPLYQLKVSNGSFPYGKIIDPSKILNEHLLKDELYSTGGYGIGSREAPQSLGTIYRYALTDLDEETYYIIEGIKVEDNNQAIDNTQGDGGDRAGANAGGNAAGGGGGGSYKFPHAIGAVVVFIKMLVKVFSKLIPSIMKLLKLFSNPMAFVTDIIMEKLGESFSIFSPEAKKKFDGASKLVKEKKKYNKPKPPTVPGRPTPNAPNMGDYVRKMKGHFENSPLKNHVAVDSLGSFKDASGKIPKTPSKDAVGNFKFVYDGVGFIPFKIFGKDLSFGMELKMANIITKEWGNPSPMKLIFNKEKNSKDPNNIGVTGPKTDDGNNADSKDAAMVEANTDPNSNGNANQGLNGSTDPNKRYVTLSTWYSTGEFINGVDYKYVYIDQQDEDLLKQVDELSGSIDPDDLKKAKDLLQEALDKDPDDDALKNKLDEIKKKMFDLNSNTQPLLKMILGIVTLPIKIVAGIIEWLMKFFKSLTNPIALPGKIIEFLSFKWIMEFFSPTGILKMAGVNFDPSLPAQWMSKVNQVNPNKNLSPEEMKKKAEAKAKDAKGQAVDKPADIKGKAGDSAAKTKGDAANAKDAKANAKDAAGKAKGVSPADAKAAGAEKIPKVDKDIPLHKGSYAMPDDFELADLSKFLNVAFLAQLPTYTTKDMREQGKNIPKRVFSPIICFIEKLINGIIDFIWSILGIECIIPPPHIKLCKSDDADTMDPEELNKLLNGETPGSGEGGTPAADINFKTQIVATDPEVSVQSPPLEMYVYEITLPDGKVVRATDREELDKFIQENRDLGYDFQF